MQNEGVEAAGLEGSSGDDTTGQDELFDEADEFEEELAAELIETGVIEVWN